MQAKILGGKEKASVVNDNGSKSGISMCSALYVSLTVEVVQPSALGSPISLVGEVANSDMRSRAESTISFSKSRTIIPVSSIAGVPRSGEIVGDCGGVVAGAGVLAPGSGCGAQAKNCVSFKMPAVAALATNSSCFAVSDCI